MKIKNLYLKITALVAVGVVLIAADHIDAPSVAGGGSDVTDFYAFQAADPNNLVFVANVQGLLSPSATSAADFDENVMIEFNIDVDQDQVEDYVIRAVPKNKKMYFAGPIVPETTGTTSTFDGVPGNEVSFVKVTEYGQEPRIATNAQGLKFFAGPRDDPFFFDFVRYSEIIGGTATAFNDPGTDTFAGTNVLSIVVEVPKALIGGSGTINTWVESKRKQ